jgi:hypothetical protein
MVQSLPELLLIIQLAKNFIALSMEPDNSSQFHKTQMDPYPKSGDSSGCKISHHIALIFIIILSFYVNPGSPMWSLILRVTDNMLHALPIVYYLIKLL